MPATKARNMLVVRIVIISSRLLRTFAENIGAELPTARFGIHFPSPRIASPRNTMKPNEDNR